jgi:glycosyltransferase involved in cell wall biosynthesis
MMRHMDKPNKNTTAPNPLKIALVTETYLPEVNGVANTVGRMVDGLLKLGHYIHMIRPRQHEQDAATHSENYQETLVSGMQIPRYQELKLGLPAKKLLINLWNKERPDIVHISTEGPLGWSALSAARRLNIPVSSSFHTNFHSYSHHYRIGLLKRPIAAYLRYFHNKTGCTMVPTDALRLRLESKGYNNVLVVSRGVDTEQFNPTKRSVELRASWNADSDTPVVMLVSRIAPEKNLNVVFLAFEQMRKINPRAQLVIVGDGPARSELEKENPDVIFAGMQTGEALAQHYASGDIFLYPSLTETYGNVVIEAMASSLAAVAFNYAAAHQHINHNVNGVLVPFADTDAFITMSSELISDMERVQRIRSTALETAVTLTWEHIVGEMEIALLDTIRKQGEQNAKPELSVAAD